MNAHAVSFLLSSCGLAAAGADFPVFDDRPLHAPPLSLSAAIRRGELMPDVPERSRATLPIHRSSQRPPRYVTRMPIIPPAPGVDYKIAVIPPDPSVDFRMLIKDPEVANAGDGER